MASTEEALPEKPTDLADNGGDFADYESQSQSSMILEARIALLSTAIGGPDHSSSIEPPPYKIGDDCLACLKDLKRWFKLVDERQSRWDVAAAAAHYNIFTDDLLPIMTNWEQSYSAAATLTRKRGGKIEDYLKNKAYNDKIALNALQLMVLMTWPLILTDQSTQNHVEHYSRLKKSQVIYKKAILSSENGKALKGAVRLAVEVIKIEKRLRSARDNVTLRLVLNFLRNVAAIEPSDLTLSSKKSLSKGINSRDMLPPNISKSDISLAAVIEAFSSNKVFGLLLTLSSSLNKEFDAAFINIPLMELMFFLVKNVNHSILLPRDPKSHGRSKQSVREEGTTEAGQELSKLLQKEHMMRKNVIQNTSTRHSRFGTMLSIQTPDNRRLTVSGGQNLLNGESALQKMDSRKKWNKRNVSKNETVEGLPSNFMTFGEETTYWSETTALKFRKFIDDFMKSGFNVLLHSATGYFTTEDGNMVIVHQIQYLLFYAWFLKYHRTAQIDNKITSFEAISFALRDTALILVGQLLRKAVETKIWAVVHAGMIAFKELFSLLESMGENEREIIDHIEHHIFQEERLKLFSVLPRTASNHSVSYVRSCIQLVHVLLKILESKAKASELVEKGSDAISNREVSYEEEAKILAEEEGIELEEAFELLDPMARRQNINFKRVQRSFANESTVKTYITFLQNFKELADEDIKKCIQFLYRIFVSIEEESLLYRIDFLILVKEMLSPTGLPMMSKSKKYVVKFADIFMTRFKERLKSSPSWYVGILFPAIHDREAGHYQRYGEELKLDSTEKVVTPSEFRLASLIEGMSSSAVLDLKFGVIVSTLVDKEKETCVEALRDNLRRSCDTLKSWLLSEASRGDNTVHNLREKFEAPNPVVQRAVHGDPDFRALLKLCGYVPTRTTHEKCVLSENSQIAELEVAADLITKYLNNTFDTPNGEPSSFYLNRPALEGSRHPENDVINGNTIGNEYEADNIDQEENQYFQALAYNMTTEGRNEDSTGRGVGLKKKKQAEKKDRSIKKKRKIRVDENRLPELPGEISESVSRTSKVTSAEFISDSDESEDEGVRSAFYENEMYMRYLLDKHNGSLPHNKFIQFAVFSSERMQNGGHTINDYTDLFDGPVPSLLGLKNRETCGSDNLAPRLNEALAKKIEEKSPLSIPQDNTFANDLPTNLTSSRSLSPNSSTEASGQNDTDASTDNERMNNTTQLKKRRRLRIDDDDDDE